MAGPAADRQGAGAGEAAPIALIAGAGDLPLAAAEALAARGRMVLVVPVEGQADRDYSAFANAPVSMGAVARLREILLSGGCRDVLMLGTFRRPSFGDVDWNLGTVRALSRIMMLRFGGDDAAVNGVAALFEAEGFRVVGPREAVPELIVREGPLTRRKGRRHAADIATAFRAIARMGDLDIGQALVVVDRRIVAVEAAEGTTAMIERVAGLRAAGRLPGPAPSGVVVKGLKPGQETRMDMPAVGPETIAAARASGLAGLALEADGVLAIRRDEMIRLADEAGMFVVGVRPEAASQG